MARKNNNEYAQLMEILKEAREMYQTEEELTFKNFKDDCVNPEKVESLMTEKTLTEIKNDLSDDEKRDEIWKSICDIPEDMVAITGTADPLEWLKVLADGANAELKVQHYFNEMDDLMKSKQELEDLEQEANDNIKEYMDYLNSPEYEEKVITRKKEFADRLEAEKKKEKPDISLIRHLEKEIQLINDRYNLGFLIRSAERISMKSILENFFNDKKSNYSLQRYSEKCKQISINPNVFRYYFNLEEKFLEKKYHPFNNLFLFTCVQFIGHVDTAENAEQIRIIIRDLHKLFYNKFSSDAAREEFLNTVRGFLDKFIEAGYTDKFVKENITWEEHPNRKKKDAEREKKAREQIYDQIIKQNYSDKITDELRAMTLSELYNYLNMKNIEKLEKAAAANKAANSEADDAEPSDEEAHVGKVSIPGDGITDPELKDMVKKKAEEDVNNCHGTDGRILEDQLNVGDEVNE